MLIQSVLEEMLPLSRWRLRLALISLNEILRMRLETGKICSFCFFFGNIISNAGIFFPFPEIKCFQFLKPSPIYESILQLCSWGTASLCCHLQDELEMIVIVADSWGLATPHPCQPAVKSCGMCPGLDSSIDQ
jgi:hypothetical protein